MIVCVIKHQTIDAFSVDAVQCFPCVGTIVKGCTGTHRDMFSVGRIVWGPELIPRGVPMLSADVLW
jgi:hypothetical protein